jgi:hypothetical protein
VALTEALKLSKEQRVNIYTDSKFAFLILHAHAVIWKERGMITTTESPIRYACNILALLDAVQLPKEVSMIHYRGHQKGEDKTAKRNKAADKAAKGAAMQENTTGPLFREGTFLPPERPHYWSEESKQASDQGYQLDHQGRQVSSGGKLWLPETFQWKILKTFHQIYHLGLNNTLVLVNKMFVGTTLRDTTQQVVQRCETCQKIIPIIKDSRCQGHRGRNPIPWKTGN